jgi:hypothetical protein
MKRVVVLFALALTLTTTERVHAQVCSDAVVMLQAVTSQTPLRMVLQWQADTGTVSQVVSRRVAGAPNWTAGKTIIKKDTTYTDSTIVAGTEYEYRMIRNTKRAGSPISAIGYIRTGVASRIGDDPGACILLVDRTYATELAPELDRLQQDLLAEGRVVHRIDVSAQAAVPSVKAQLSTLYDSDPDNISTLFIFGHVPVPYSGFINPDGHPDHFGGWPADVYYGEFDGDWTDVDYDTATTRRVANHNVAGDGKFDQSALPDDVNLQIGRVDLSNMTAFTKSEKELLKQYLDKDHAYRTGALLAPERGLIDDNFGYFGGEAFASSGWRNFAPLVGKDSLHEVDWFTTLATDPYLFAYGCGGGYDQGAGGIGATSDFASKDPHAIFTLLFGSYFGDWNTQSNFLRAPLCTSYGLTCAWSGRPYWDIFPMGMGHSTGEVAMLTQNNQGSYTANFANYWVHVALMGDPTLRVRPFATPASVSLLNDVPNNKVTINWTGDPTLVGYNVYRVSVKRNHFELLTTTPVVVPSNGAASYVDLSPLADSAYYIVRGIRNETTKSGNYLNLSHGATALSTGGYVDEVLGAEVVSSRLSVIYPLAGNIATVVLDLGSDARISVEVVDMQGRTVTSLISGPVISGHHLYDWNFSNVRDGLYFVRITGDVEPLTSKILVIKNRF